MGPDGAPVRTKRSVLPSTAVCHSGPGAWASTWWGPRGTSSAFTALTFGSAFGVYPKASVSLTPPYHSVSVTRTRHAATLAPAPRGTLLRSPDTPPLPQPGTLRGPGRFLATSLVTALLSARGPGWEDSAGPQSVQWGLGIQAYVLGSQVECPLPYEATGLHAHARPGRPDVGVHDHSAARARGASRPSRGTKLPGDVTPFLQHSADQTAPCGPRRGGAAGKDGGTEVRTPTRLAYGKGTHNRLFGK